MEEYDSIMSIESVLPFIVGYVFHGVMAVAQVLLGVVFLVSGTLGWFSNITLPGVFSYLGIMIVEDRQSRKIFAASLFISGALLLASGVTQLPMSISLFSIVASLCLTLCFIFFPELGKGQQGEISRILIVVFCVSAIIITLFNQESPAATMKQIVVDIVTYRPKEQQWQNEYDVDAPKVGQYAPDFELLTVHGDRKVKLSGFVGDKPTVLFLGANTCPVFSAGMASINRLHDQYKEDVNFVGVYVSEPHGIDEWPIARAKTLQIWEDWVEHPVVVDLEQAVTYRQRRFAAMRMQQTLLSEGIPMLVDGMDNHVNNTWVGRPARLYLISKDGKIIYNPGKGPYSFNPNYLEPLLKSLL